MEYFERPEIEPHLRLLWQAFSELSTERQFGMGIGPIPRSKIRDYLIQELEFTGATYDHAYAVLRHVDSDYLSVVNVSERRGGMDKQGHVAASDPAAMKSMFGAVAKKPNSRDKAKNKK